MVQAFSLYVIVGIFLCFGVSCKHPMRNEGIILNSESGWIWKEII
jgi:hypothetical protein